MVSVITSTQNYYADLCDEIRLFYDERNIPLLTEIPEEGYCIHHKLRYEDDKIINTSSLYIHKEKKDSYTYISNKTDSDNRLDITRAEKHGAKISVYRLLASYTKKEKPWGSLTGVRPVKMFRDMVKADGLENTISRMKNEYDVEEDKLSLLEGIYEVQKPFMENINLEHDIDIYIGIPFCTSRCFYCSFFSLLASKDGTAEKLYTDALIEEIRRAEPFLKSRNISSVYMGGGTPTALGVGDLERVLKEIAPYARDKEFTVEAGRPDTITEEKLSLLKKYGVNRISINPQTTCQKTLDLVGRKHTIEDFRRAIRIAKKYSFDSVNMDLIAGLPGEDKEIFLKSVRDCMEAEPENITVHTLSIKKGSKYGMENKKGYANEEEASEMITGARKLLEEKGYFPYYLYKQKYMAGNLENVGYSKKRKECIYNINMMEDETNVISFGLGTSSRRVFGRNGKIRRYFTTKDMRMYLENTENITENKLELFRNEMKETERREDNSMIKLVIFDLDGTIADTIPDIANSIVKTISKYGTYENIEEQTRKAIGNGARKLLERIYAWNDIPMDSFDEDLAFYSATYAVENCIDTVLYPGTRELFETLKSMGIKMAVATMKPKGATNGVLDSLDVTKYMEIILSADDMEKAKPDPWSVEYIAEKCGVKPSETMMVGDSMTDVGSGINAGAVSVCRMGGYYDQEIMKDCNADYFVDNVDQILDIIKEINERND